ncbi:MAG TPA: PRC-barrel domain-containing protein [Aestuariivirga sp.]|nr:PRC-barrel domain-containing protein [Aestuariivirga sp.]
MTKTPIIIAFATTLMVSSAAFAATGDFGKIDANADGKITLEEGMKLHPDWTAEAFKALDTNADGFLNDMEYETAVTAAPAASDPAATTADPAAPAATSTQAATTMRKDGPASYLDAAGPNDVLASNLIGMRIYAVEADIDDTKAYPADSRKDWNDVGEVNDVVLDWDGSVKAVVLGVGGFLGIGEKDVAIEMSSLRKVRETNDSNDWFLVVNSSKDLLTSAPAYVRNTKS